MDGNLLKLLPLSKFSLFATLNLFTITGKSIFFFFLFFFLERFAYFARSYDKRCGTRSCTMYGVKEIKWTKGISAERNNSTGYKD